MGSKRKCSDINEGCLVSHTATKWQNSMSRSKSRSGHVVLWSWPGRITCGPASVLDNGGLNQGMYKEVQEAAEPSRKEHGHCFPACDFEHLCVTRLGLSNLSKP